MNSPSGKHMQTDLHSIIKHGHNRIALLLNSHRYLELAVLLQSLQNRLNEYYKFTPAISKDHQAIRTINKVKKRQEIVLLHNQAVLSMKQNKIELAIDIRTNILEELDSVLQGEQKRYGFLDEDDQKQRNIAMESIAYWKRQLIKHYYFFARLTYLNGSLEIALTALMKGLDLIKQCYQKQIKIGKESLSSKEKGKRTQEECYSQRLSHFEQVQELFLLQQLREKVSHSKHLNIVGSNILTEIICSIYKQGNNKDTFSSEFEMFDINKMNELELPKLEDIVSHAYKARIQTSLYQFNKVGHLLYLGLLSKTYSDQNNQTQNQYQKLKNAKNVVFLHVLQVTIAHYYLRNSQSTQQLLQEYRHIYKSKSIRQTKTTNIYNLIQIFGLRPQNLAQITQSQQEVSIIQMNKKNIVKHTKRVKSTQKKRSKSQPKSTSKGKKIPGRPVKKQNRQKPNKKKVRQEYMIKRDTKIHPKASQNHLMKAIGQNYLSFDISISKEKSQSPFKRTIRTETCINDKKMKSQRSSVNTQLVHRQKKLS